VNILNRTEPPEEARARRPFLSPPGIETAANALPAEPAARVEASRREILAAIGAPPDVTFVRSIGNLGDELIWAGTRRLLAGLPAGAFREVGLAEAATASGHTAVLAGGGAWCRPYHEALPKALGTIESRFERVIVLPSSFDPEVPEVRRALSRSRAVVFARERESYRRISDLCAARLALDGAFFFDFSPYRQPAPGQGVLHAFRTDAEASGRFPLPADNRDLSLTASSLDEWLWTLARHATVRTDRAHVMIAAALLGLTVLFRPSSYHKLPAIAEYALEDFPVREERGGELGPRGIVAVPALPGKPTASQAAEVSEARDGMALAALRRRLAARGEAALAGLPADLFTGPPRVTAVVLSWDRIEQTTNALGSLAAQVRLPLEILVVDNGSAPAVREALASLAAPAESAARTPNLRLLLLPENRGCAGARQLAVDHVTTEYLFFLDNDAEVFPGTIERLVHELDGHPKALAAGARVVLPTGEVQFCGGDYRVEGGLLRFLPHGRGAAFDDPALGALGAFGTLGGAGACRWLGATALLVRRAALAEFPLDTGMAAYFEDNEWCYRVERARPGSLRRSAEALALHHHELKGRPALGPMDLAAILPGVIPYVEAVAHFYRLHGLVLDGLFAFVPELLAVDGTPDVAAAQLLLDLLLAEGPDRLLARWRAGGLAPLFAGIRAPRPEEVAALEARLVRADGELVAARETLAVLEGSRLGRMAALYWSLRRRFSGGARLPRGAAR
jgi:GT2 family glycosyltransferase